MKNSTAKPGFFEQLTQRQKLEALLHRFGNQPFTIRNRSWYYVSLLYTFLVNIVSIMTAYYGLLWLIERAISNYYVAAGLTIILLVLVVLSQRKSSDNFWDNFWMTKKPNYGWLALSVFLMSASMASSGWGTYQTAQENQGPPILITTDSILNDLQYQLAETNKVIESNRRTTWNGKIVEQARINISKNTDTKNMLLKEISSRRAKLEADNEIIIEDDAEEKHFVGLSLFLLYILMEVTFEGCMCFCSYYDFRKFCEQIEELPYPEQVKLIENKVLESNAHFLPAAHRNSPKIGFFHNRNNYSNSAETVVAETTKQQSTAPPPTVVETAQQLVPQATQPVAAKKETTVSTKVVTAPNTEISDWKKRAGVYYKRSIKKSSTKETRDSNRETYEEYRDLILSTGEYQVNELTDRVEFIKFSK